jgi:hypothetical protein
MNLPPVRTAMSSHRALRRSPYLRLRIADRAEQAD